MSPVILRLPRRGLVAVTGGSGAGKTLLIHGLLCDAVDKGLAAKLAEQHDRCLAANLTAEVNLALGCGEAAEDREHRCRQVHDVASALGLERVLSKRVRKLSGGQRRLVAVGQALACSGEWDVLFLDEPSSGVDLAGIELLRRALREAATGTCVVVATHDGRIAALANGTVRIEGGRVVECSGMASVARAPAEDPGYKDEDPGCDKEVLDGEAPGHKPGFGLKRFGSSAETAKDLGRALGRPWFMAALLALMLAVPFASGTGVRADQGFGSADLPQGAAEVFLPVSLEGRDLYAAHAAVPIAALELLDENVSMSRRLELLRNLEDQTATPLDGSWLQRWGDGLRLEGNAQCSATPVEWYRPQDRQILAAPDREALCSAVLLQPADGGSWKAVASQVPDDMGAWVASEEIARALDGLERLAANQDRVSWCACALVSLVAVGFLCQAAWLLRRRFQIAAWRNLGLRRRQGLQLLLRRALLSGWATIAGVAGVLACAAAGMGYLEMPSIPEAFGFSGCFDAATLFASAEGGMALWLFLGGELAVALLVLQLGRSVIIAWFAKRIFDWRFR